MFMDLGHIAFSSQFLLCWAAFNVKLKLVNANKKTTRCNQASCVCECALTLGDDVMMLFMYFKHQLLEMQTNNRGRSTESLCVSLELSLYEC